jgi:lipopolysaccharide transport system ATP-binding protein
VIQAEGLGKSYLIGHQGRGDRYTALRDVLANQVRGVWDATRRAFRGQAAVSGQEIEEFWALRDVSFDVTRGQVVGIIGRNGAGKSTLLKILSRITEPTEGRVSLRGRVASLLEVGTGFHPELTGRENIYLNGAILGMTRAEIKRKFDEIVAFAGVEKFLDTPVKRYSSGMHVRLAFAVAAHLEPEIMLIDEVLAVGDAEFQKKCLGKMEEVAKGGRTILFVSHNMNAVELLCNQAILLVDGRIANSGSDVRRIITSYFDRSTSNNGSASQWRNSGSELDHHSSKPLYFAIRNASGVPLSAPVRNDEQLSIVIRAEVREPDPALNFGIALFNEDGQMLLWSLTTDGAVENWPRLEPGVTELRCMLPKRFLNEGRYRIELIASLHYRDWFVRPGFNSPAIHFEIQGGLSDSPYWMSARPGILAPSWEWQSVPQVASEGTSPAPRVPVRR